MTAFQTVSGLVAMSEHLSAFDPKARGNGIYMFGGGVCDIRYIRIVGHSGRAVFGVVKQLDYPGPFGPGEGQPFAFPVYSFRRWDPCVGDSRLSGWAVSSYVHDPVLVSGFERIPENEDTREAICPNHGRRHPVQWSDIRIDWTIGIHERRGYRFSTLQYRLPRSGADKRGQWVNPWTLGKTLDAVSDSEIDVRHLYGVINDVSARWNREVAAQELAELMALDAYEYTEIEPLFLDELKKPKPQ